MEGLITVAYRTDRSTIPGAGKGFFVEEDVAAGRVLMAPTHVTTTVRLAEIFSPQPPPGADTSVVWFEDHCLVSPELADDYFVNHSFDPQQREAGVARSRARIAISGIGRTATYVRCPTRRDRANTTARASPTAA